jgi:hypothetical protein
VCAVNNNNQKFIVNGQFRVQVEDEGKQTTVIEKKFVDERGVLQILTGFLAGIAVAGAAVAFKKRKSSESSPLLLYKQYS